MTNVALIERRVGPEFDTEVRPLSTLRGPVSEEDPAFESRAILADVQHAVRATSERDLRRVAALDAGLAFQPKVLLSLLAYCYATGTYSSADIEDLMRRDGTFRHLCQQEFPSARVLKRFRRENQVALRDYLQVVLQLQFRRERQRQRLRQCQYQGLREDALAQARLGDDLTEEAEGRVLKAMFIDRMEDEND